MEYSPYQLVGWICSINSLTLSVIAFHKAESSSEKVVGIVWGTSFEGANSVPVVLTPHFLVIQYVVSSLMLL